jgi:hypothetical protein
MRAFVFIVLSCVSALTAAALATDSGNEQKITTKPRDTSRVAALDLLVDDTSRIILRIEPRTVSGRRINDTLDIRIESFGSTIAAFDLKFGTSNPYMNIVDVLPGRIIDSCKWEFFNAREVGSAGAANRPRQLWHAVGLAKMFGDSALPACYGFDVPASVARIVVSNEHVLQMPETSAAIFFFWETCTDNCLSGISGRSMVISSSVLDFFPVEFPDLQSALPSRKGAPNQCIIPGKPNPPKRRIEFHNGGIKYVIRSADSSVKNLDVKDKVLRDTLKESPNPPIRDE